MIELRMLGGCDLRDTTADTDIVSLLAQPKRLALVVYLALAEPRGFHRRDTLLALFWPEFDEKRARGALRRALHFVRTHLGEDVVEGRGAEELRLSEERAWCDVWGLRDSLSEGRLERALELYVGELMPGFYVAGCPDFDRWLELQRSAARRAAAQGARSLAAEAETDGRVLVAAGWLRRALEIAPEDEATLRSLIGLLASAGDRTGALRAYETFSRSMSERYDLEPGRETVELARSIEGPGPAATAGRNASMRTPRQSRAGGEDERSRGEGQPAGPTSRKGAEPAAYDLYVRGQELVERDREGNQKAIELFREAIRIDPDFAEAHSALATTYAHEVELFGAPRTLSRIGIETARRAIALDPELPAAHLALGQNLETLRRLTDAGMAYRRAIELSPTYAAAHWSLAQLSIFAGDFATAVVGGERSLAITPGDPRPFLVLGLAYYCLDCPEEAEAWYARALAVHPEFIWAEASLAYFRANVGRVTEAIRLHDDILSRDPGNWVGLVGRGWTELIAGDWSAARGSLERASAIDPDGRHTGVLRTVAVALACALLKTGERTWAEELLDRGEALNQRDIAEGTEFGGVSVDLAAIRAFRGDPIGARRWLERASGRDRWRQFRYGRCDPTLAPLRGEPWFEGWLEDMEAGVAAQRERVLARPDRVAPP